MQEKNFENPGHNKIKEPNVPLTEAELAAQAASQEESYNGYLNGLMKNVANNEVAGALNNETRELTYNGDTADGEAEDARTLAINLAASAGASEMSALSQTTSEVMNKTNEKLAAVGATNSELDFNKTAAHVLAESLNDEPQKLDASELTADGNTVNMVNGLTAKYMATEIFEKNNTKVLDSLNDGAAQRFASVAYEARQKYGNNPPNEVLEEMGRIVASGRK